MTTTDVLKNIHIFEALGHKLAFNGNTYDVALLNNIGFKILSRSIEGELLTGEEAVISEAICDSLMTSPYAKMHNFLNNENAINEQNTFVRFLCLNIVSNCNMKCDYCFNNQGAYERKACQAMSMETARNAIDFLLTNCKDRCSVSFFGGEPLLNFPLIKETVTYANKQAQSQDKAISFHVTTNGTLITPEIARFLKLHDFSLIISLDGDEATHDYHRRSTDGLGTYHSVIRGINIILNEYGSQERITIRGTYTRQQTSFAHSFAHLINEGFEHMSIEPAIGNDQNGYAIRSTDLPVIAREYEKLAKSSLRSLSGAQQVSFFHFSRLLGNLENLRTSDRPCGAANGYMAVSPDGGLFPCHRIIDDQYKLGNVNEIEQWNNLDEKIRHEFRNAVTSNRPICCGCWARNLCGGSCYAHNVEKEQDLYGIDHIGCELFKLRAELAIGLFVEKKLPDRNNNYLSSSEYISIFRGEPASELNYMCDACETCEVDCDEGCTAMCEWDCKAGCQSNNCETGCELSCDTPRMND